MNKFISPAKKRPSYIWILVGLIAVGIVFVPMPVTAASPSHHSIHVKASSFDYNPATIKVNRGDQITIEFESTDVVHGFYIDGYDFELISEPGQPVRSTFIANNSGSFRIRCSVTCGDLHPFMIGKLQVNHNDFLWRSIGLAFLAVLTIMFLYQPSF